MNVWQSITIINLGLFVCIALVAFFTKSPWALLGLLFISSGSSDDDCFDKWNLDFTQVLGNEHVQAQGEILCIKTRSKGFFCPELERYPTRQDLAIKTKL